MSQIIQELEAKLAAVTDRIAEIDLLNELARHLTDIDIQRSLAIGQKSHSLAQQPPTYAKGVYDSLLNLSICHMRMSHLDKAMDLVLQAYSMATYSKKVEPTPSLFSILGSLYMDLGEYTDSLSHFLQAHDLAQKQKHREAEVNALNNLGIIYYHLNEHLEGLKSYEKALLLYKELGKVDMQAILLNNMALSYKALTELDTAVATAQQSIQLARQHSLPMVEGTALCTLGSLFLEKGDTKQARYNLKQSTALATELSFHTLEIFSLRLLGEAEQKARNFEASVALLHQSLSKASESLNQPEQANCHRALADTYKLMGEATHALTHFEKFYEIEKKMHHEDAARQRQKLQIVHQIKNIEQKAESYKQRMEGLDAYARSVAHDLKQPIVAITAYIELLPLLMPELPPDSKPFTTITKIQQASEQIARTVDSLLLLATVNKTEVKLEPLNMATAVHNVLERLQEMIKTYQGKIILPAQWEHAVGYQPWVEEVWLNYLTNGLKYGGAMPILALGSESLSPNHTRFWIKDNGPGISDDVREALFDEFSRFSTATNHSHGMGLAIVRRIVEKLGGDVGFSSQPKQGSEFYFTLPTALT